MTDGTVPFDVPPRGEPATQAIGPLPRPPGPAETLMRPPEPSPPANSGADALGVGAALGPYHVVERLHRDGQATIFKAYDPALARHVAIRVLPVTFVGDPGFRARFEQEAVAIGRLRHPNILTILDYGEEGDLIYLVTEFVDGGTLAERLGTPLPSDEVLRLVVPIASALDYAHALAVIHRDVKPSNILINPEGAPILTDFGIINNTDRTLRLTAASTVVGTPAYASPEQLLGEAAVPASDQYALAAITYELLTGVPLPPVVAVGTAPVEPGQPPILPPPIGHPALSPAAEAALRKALAGRPEARFPSVGDFVDALGSGSPVAPPRERRRTTTRRSRLVPSTLEAPRPRPVPRAPLAAVALLMLLAAVLLLPRSSVSGRRGLWNVIADAVPQRAGSTATVQTSSAMPTSIPTSLPLVLPTLAPTAAPVAAPTALPTVLPTAVPTVAPTAVPTNVPTAAPSPSPVPPTPTPGCTMQPAQPGVASACRLQETSAARPPAGYSMQFAGSEYVVRSSLFDMPVVSAIGSASGDLYGDATIAVDARLVGDTADRTIILLCRVTQASAAHSGYLFQINPSAGQSLLTKLDNGRPATLVPWSPTAAIKAGAATNHLELDCLGNSITARVNGVEVFRVTDPAALPPGDVEIGVSRLAPGQGTAEARFSNLTVGPSRTGTDGRVPKEQQAPSQATAGA